MAATRRSTEPQICEHRTGGASVPMYLRYAQEFQSSDEGEKCRIGILDRINLFIIYYVGGYLCNLDLLASRHEVEEDDTCEQTDDHWPVVGALDHHGGGQVQQASAHAGGHGDKTTKSQAKAQAQAQAQAQAHGSFMGRALMVRKYFTSGVRQSKWKRELKFGWYPQVALVCYLASLVYLLTTVYYQYVYDFDLLRLLRMRRLHSRWSEALAGDVLEHELPPGDPRRPQEMAIMRRMNVTRATIQLLGPIYSHLTILAEGLLLVMIALTLGIYLATYLHFRLQQPFHFHFVSNLLNSKRENANIRRMLERQVGKFVESNRKYHENICRFDSSLSHRTKVVKLFPSLLSDDCLADTLRTIRKREHEVHKMVREMLSTGSLTPLYKSNPWRERRALIQFYYHLLIFVYSFLFDSILNYTFISQASSSQLWAQAAGARHNSWCLKLSHLALLVIALPSVTLYAGIFMVVVLEQNIYVDQLRRMIKQCIQANTNEFHLKVSARKLHSKRNSLQPQAAAAAAAAAASHEIAGRHSRFVRPRLSTTSSNFKYDWALQNLGEDEEECARPSVDRRAEFQQDIGRGDDGGDGDDDDDESNALVHEEKKIDSMRELDWDEHARTMNSNLIFSLMHSKIFIAQLMPMKHSIGFGNFIAFYLLFTIPIIIGLNEPYLNQLNDGHLSPSEIKIFALAFGVSILIPVNLVNVPICHFSARCQDLYKDLASLMAHISEVKAHPMGKNIYDSHAESCLLKEVADPRRLLEQMTVRACGLSGTYTVSLKTHFWYGLLAISILADNNNNKRMATTTSAGSTTTFTTTCTHNQELLDVILSDPLGVYK